VKGYFSRILEGFEYQSLGEWFGSLSPTYKYNFLSVGMGVSASATVVETLFGLDWLAFIGLMVVMVFELVSGVWASKIKQEDFSSRKMSRFTFKCAVYLVLIAVPYLLAESFQAREKDLAAGIFNWMHVFFTVQIVLENIISILENYAVIQGKDKTHWISRLQNKADQILQ
jgi:phage-related holin